MKVWSFFYDFLSQNDFLIKIFSVTIGWRKSINCWCFSLDEFCLNPSKSSLEKNTLFAFFIFSKVRIIFETSDRKISAHIGIKGEFTKSGVIWSDTKFGEKIRYSAWANETVGTGSRYPLIDDTVNILYSRLS